MISPPALFLASMTPLVCWDWILIPHFSSLLRLLTTSWREQKLCIASLFAYVCADAEANVSPVAILTLHLFSRGRHGLQFCDANLTVSRKLGDIGKRLVAPRSASSLTVDTLQFCSYMTVLPKKAVGFTFRRSRYSGPASTIKPRLCKRHLPLEHYHATKCLLTEHLWVLLS